MFGRRCSLCNGKLDSRHICKECGLDNTKSDKYYKINQSSCDDMPLTHVHEEKKQKPKTDKRVKKTQAKTKNTYRTGTSQKKNEKSKKAGVISIISIILVLASTIGSIVGLLTESYDTKPDYNVEEVYSPYDYVDKEHPADGEYAEYSLTSGDYIVGIHLPEGDYAAIVEDDFDTVQVKDNENGIYLYEYPVKSGGNYLNDLRLFNGAIVSISTKTEIELQSSNAQYQNMGIMIENPLKDVVVLDNSAQLVAGEDFAAGIYNLYAASDYAYFYMMYEDEYGEEWEYYNGLEIGEESERGMLYQNVVIPEGATVWCEEKDIELLPANAIGDMDYSRYYW